MAVFNYEAAVEGILFASGDPIGIARVAAVLGVGEAVVIMTAEALAGKYESEKRGVRIVRIDDSYQMCSSPEFADIIRIALEKGRPPRLSAQALETLAVVAYFQPVTRAYIEQVRGVDCTNTLQSLTTRGLIEKRGYLAVPGRPGLYKTNDEFLRTFGLRSLDELPPLPGGEPDGQLLIEDFVAD